MLYEVITLSDGQLGKKLIDFLSDLSVCSFQYANAAVLR